MIVARDAKSNPHSSSEPHKPKYIWPAFEKIAEWIEKEESHSITCLGESRDERGLLICDLEIVG